ncbi:peptide chain release factor N(5)-glutamine methyltransferase [Buchnera aphidicola (Melanaphis sacchari)]|uniref:Release factor glutamine methyltransferase n=1 Tax=Buchnera aphidicola (Melanaphis sacchari) TaxID=2173854 RepID=A0A2U8DGJ9_9GAMM|nr:peptide chain release factor N(5)-glutamine methyltransferase [Buchnera aphidicola]AWH90595.1 peptide chain release factor N(5)-glutamine methyltransferase [Buchnera aphidicola (Melanaphis sacchari)]
MNINKWLKKTVKILSHLDNPRYEAKLLLSYVVNRTYSSIILLEDIKLNLSEYHKLKSFIYRRSMGEPIAYITGKKEFWSLSFRVSYDTLIPRPDTEILIEKVLSKIDMDKKSILDLGTGCGAIALSLASICSNWKIFGVDKSHEAIKIAKINALELNIKNVTFFYSDWFSNIEKKFHVIISNPPYISMKEIKSLEKDIFFEPFFALFSKKNGLSDIAYIIKKSKKYLFYGGWLFIEHSWQQRLNVQNFLKSENFSNIESYKDYAGNYRVTIGRKKK